VAHREVQSLINDIFCSSTLELSVGTHQASVVSCHLLLASYSKLTVVI